MMLLCTEQASRVVLNPLRSAFKGYSSVNTIFLSQHFSFQLQEFIIPAGTCRSNSATCVSSAKPISVHFTSLFVLPL